MKLKFKNIDGELVELEDSTTIEELVKRGISVSIQPKEEPMPTDKNTYVHTS